MQLQFHDLLAESANTRPDAPALTYRDVTLTYRQLWSDAKALAGGLLRLGVGPEDRVAIFLEKRPETVISLFGISASGGAFVPINPLLKPDQVAYILVDCSVTVLITSLERWAQIAQAAARCPALEHVILVGGNTVEPAACAQRTLSWHASLSGADEFPGGCGIDMDIAAILYTSGSTGKPKGVVLTHRNLIVGAQSVSSYLGNSPNDVILAALPLSFDAGLSQVTTAFCVGAHVILLNYLLANEVVRLCERHQVTGLTCVPPLWIQLSDQDWPESASRNLRYFANTGGKMPETVLKKLRAHLPRAKPYLMYGLTEAFRSTYLDPAEIDRRPDSIGKAIPNAEVLVVRPDGSLCSPGEEGELVHRGALVALGYWNDPTRTRERFRPSPGRSAPWRSAEIAVWSGDTVVTDSQGFLYFVGRKDDMIKTSGYRVSPTEIEEAAYASGLVRDAVAVGVEDADLGQRIVLVYAPLEHISDRSSALAQSLRQRLPRYMVPTEFLAVDSIPRSPNGKFDRVRVRTRLEEC